MVRLRLGLTQGLLPPRKSFNPTMVRLRPELGLPVPNLVLVSIPLWCDCDPCCRNTDNGSESGFNPTMVRLRLAVGGGVILLRHHCFNPTMVRLRLSGNLAVLDFDSGFNPTMVRLRPFNEAEDFSLPYVSIPLWCDCDAWAQFWQEVKEQVSIPLWCDCDPIAPKAGRQAFFRFNPTMVRLRLGRTRMHDEGPLLFQSHYGAIATRKEYR